MGGGEKAPKPAPPPARVDYKKEAPRTDAKSGKKRRPAGLYGASRSRQGMGGGFGGQAKTLG